MTRSRSEAAAVCIRGCNDSDVRSNLHWLEYRASLAQWHAERRARRPKLAKLVTNERFRTYVQDRLVGEVRDSAGRPVGPAGPAFSGRNKAHRGDRRWVQGWSPEQISQRLKVDFPDDESMRISHEAIYQALYVQGRGALKRELVACLRTGRALRVPRARARQRPGHTSPTTCSSANAPPRPRTEPCPDTGKAICSSVSSARRSAPSSNAPPGSRCWSISHAKPATESSPERRTDPRSAGYGAITMKNALAATMTSLPEQLRRSLTWDRGKELSAHVAFKVETGLPVYFADPQSPWQRGTNENTNGLLRQYFPKGTDLARWSAEEIEAVADTLNHRPRKTLGWKTPAEALNEHLRSLQQAGVATTD